MTRTAPAHPIARRVYAALLLLVGFVLIGGGGYLLSLGGSAYYLLAGLATFGSGVLVWIGDRRGLWLYAVMLAATVAWSIWEAGFDGWALVPRLVAPFVLGLGFLLPWVRHGLAVPHAPRQARLVGWPAFGVSLMAAVVVGAAAHAIGPHDYPDPLYEAGVANGAPHTAGRATTAPAIALVGDWLNYGNDVGGSRFSGLDQLTPETVGKLQVAWQVHTGPAPKGAKGSLEVTPLKVGDSVYVCTGYNDVISLDAETGHVNWRFRSGNDLTGRPSAACRGVAFYQVRMRAGCARSGSSPTRSTPG